MFGFLLYNRLTLFLAHRLKILSHTRIIVLYGMIRVAYTFVITVLVFGLEYFGLLRLEPNSFQNGSTLSSLASITVLARL